MRGPGGGVATCGLDGRKRPRCSGAITGVWWLFLITGIAWLIIALIVLRFDTTSIATVGALPGVVFLITGLNEGMIAVASPSWKWAHFALAILFVIGGFTACAKPYNAFWALASILGFLLVLKGSLGRHRLGDDQGHQRVLVGRPRHGHP